MCQIKSELIQINAHPKNYRGVFSSGGLYSADSSIRNYNLADCNNFRTLHAQGISYLNLLKDFTPLIAAARDFPNQPAPPIPGFPPNLTNFQLLILIASTPGALGANAFTPNYIFAAGDFSKSTLTYMNEQLFYQDFDTFGIFVSTAHFADIKCAVAGLDTTHYANLGSYKGHVFLYGTERAFGPIINDTANLFTHAASKKVHVLTNGRGEADYFFTNNRKTILDLPLLIWLARFY